jgi:hypothetical protein
VIERSPPFLQRDGISLNREQFPVSPYRERTLLPHSFCYGNAVQRVFYGKKMTAFFAIIQDLVSGIGGSTVDAHEMIHGIV